MPVHGAARSTTRRLAVRVILAAATVGAVVTVAASFSGAGACSGPMPSAALPGPADAGCLALVRSMAQRMGLMTAAATAIVVLTFVGLARLAAWGTVDRDGVPPEGLGS
jgi:hypothetical protein